MTILKLDKSSQHMLAAIAGNELLFHVFIDYLTFIVISANE